MTADSGPLAAVERELQVLQRQYARRNPESQRAHDRAQRHLPGGSTRSVLLFDPFPLVITQGWEAHVRDLDGHVYDDFVGEFSAGLYGHSDAVIGKTLKAAIGSGLVLSAPNEHEVAFAEALQARFPAVEKIRFCNSGTEANLWALTLARIHTGRSKVMVFRGAYHGSVLKFGDDGGMGNLPFDYVFAPFNDIDATRRLIRQHATELACVIVEPIMGAAGNIPGEPEFLAQLRVVTESHEVLLIFDEVKTSRIGPGGMQGHLGIRPDMTTLGKYLGGGLPFGAFGGRGDVMAALDRRDSPGLAHSGTFNNNVCSMAAGLAGLTKVFTAKRSMAFHAQSEAFRRKLQNMADRRGLCLHFSGLGSLFTVHCSAGPVRHPADVTAFSRAVGRLFHMFCLLNGVAVAHRGDIYQSLPMTATQRQHLYEVTAAFGETYGALLEPPAQLPPV